MLIPCIHILVLFLYSVFSLSFNSRISIKRTIVKCGVNILTYQPQAWISNMKRPIKSQHDQLKTTDKIKEVILFSSIMSLNPCDNVDISLDDEHFCSLLNDNGFIVHVVCRDKAVIDEDSLVHEVISWKRQESDNTFALIALELAVPSILRYLSQQVKSHSAISHEVAAVILLDSPSLFQLRDMKSRLHLLSRYYDSYAFIRQFKLHMKGQLETISFPSLVTKWKSYKSMIKRDNKLIKLFDYMRYEYNKHDVHERVTIKPSDDLLAEEVKLLQVESSKPAFDYDWEQFFASLPKSKKRRHPTRPRVRSEHAMREQGIRWMDDPTLTLLGQAPSNAYDVGQAMPHRMLFLSSFLDDASDSNSIMGGVEDVSLDNDSPLVNELFWENVDKLFAKADDWSFDACQDMSMLYGAGDAISVHPAYIEDHDDDDDMNAFYYGEDMDDMMPSFEHHGELWTSDDAKRHRRIATVVCDWLRMLNSCGYLSPSQTIS